MRCPSCNYENREGVRFCENCGAVLHVSAAQSPVQTAGRFCPNCGNSNPVSAHFCQVCGFSFGGYAPQQAMQVPQTRRSIGSILLYLVGCGGILALLAGGAVAIYLMMNANINLGTEPAVVVVTQPPVVVVQPNIPQPAPPTNAPLPTYTSLPTYTLVPTNTTIPFTNTPDTPTFTATQDAMCRAGPSKDFSQKAGIIAGQSATIIGRSEAKWGDWWQVNYKGVICWVWSDLGNASGNLGSITIVVVQVPPTATFTPEFYSFFVFNNAGQDLCNLYRRYSGTTNWGQDLLLGWDGTWLAAGASRTWYFPAGKYDFRAIGCSVLGGYDRIIKNVTIPNAGGITFNP